MNEAQNINTMLEMVRRLAGDKETIVVDGGSTDGTLDLAGMQQDVQLMTAAKGRANQMNAGARIASGDALLFLHCDSTLHMGALKAIEKALSETQVVGGCFTLDMDEQGLIYRIICMTSNFRAKYSRVYFGDQGIFVKKQVFEDIGGFPQIPLMEDWEFSKAMNKKGKTIQLEEKIVTSTRRFKKGGVYKTMWLMHKLKLLYKLGVSPEVLRKKYLDVR